MQKSDYDEFATYLNKDLSPSSCQVMDREDLKNFCKKMLTELEGLETDEVCISRCEKIKLPHLKPEDFRERIRTLPDGRRVWMGMRFFGMDPNAPFVEIFKSWQGMNKSDLEMINQLVKKEFANSRPQGIALYTTLDILKPHKEKLDDRDMHWVVGRIDPSVESRLTWEKQKDMSVLSDFQKSYREYYEDYPHYKLFLGVVDEEDVKESLNSGHLYKMYLNGEYCGLLAGYGEEFANQKAFYVNDEVIFRNFRGNGLGVEIQKAIHQIGNESGMKCVYGTILENNVPSLKTATRSGRKIIFGKYYLPF